MSFIRVIPTLLLKDSGLVKTVNFKKPTYIGDPINAVKIFNQKEVDELVLLDIEASKNGYEPKFEWIKDIVSESFMPIGYGGGISSLEHAKRLFELGVEKVILNSHSRNLSLIREISSIYGSQSVVVCIDVKKGLLGKEACYFKKALDKVKVTPEAWAKEVVEAGAGEIIIQSIDKEGTMEGYDLALTKRVVDAVDVPVVASGGAGSTQDLETVLLQAGASAATAGSIFVYKSKQKGVLINYPTRAELDNIQSQLN